MGVEGALSAGERSLIGQKLEGCPGQQVAATRSTHQRFAPVCCYNRYRIGL